MSNDDWVPACGGTEQPFTTRAGRRVQYCWQPSTGHHRYIDLTADLVLPREFDPHLDGTDQDPTLPPPEWSVCLEPAGIVTLAVKHAEGIWRTWQTRFERDEQRRVQLPSTLLHPPVSRISQPLALAVRDPNHALTLVRAGVVAANGETIRLNEEPVCMDFAKAVCASLGGDPGRIWPEVKLFDSPPATPAFNW